MGVFDPIIELSKGLGETLRSFLFEKTVTYQYPEEKRPFVRASVAAMS
jgi:formate hydrogenlyase subunit 6/NADH:ubiquinone oxidoreductase subunit I